MTLKTIPDIFRRCRGRETGHWRVGGELARTVHFDSGDIVFASSNHPSDKLSAIMVECGKLTQDQMDYALANLRPGLTIGKNLIEMGFITQRDLLEAARLQVGKIVTSAMLATERPVFDYRNELEESIVRLPLNTPSLLFEGTMAVTDREGLLKLLGPCNQVVQLLDGKRVYEELDLPSDLLKMAGLMDGTHTIMDISDETGVKFMKTIAFVLFLREMGWAILYCREQKNGQVDQERCIAGVIERQHRSFGVGVIVDEKYMIQNLIFIGDKSPAEVSQVYATADNQKSIIIQLFENTSTERLVTPPIDLHGNVQPTECGATYLGEAKLPLPAGLPKMTGINVTFRCSNSGLEIWGTLLNKKIQANISIARSIF